MGSFVVVGSFGHVIMPLNTYDTKMSAPLEWSVSVTLYRCQGSKVPTTHITL